MKIGNIELKHGIFAAPMAGVTDGAYRPLCAECGAEYVITELISAKALCYDDKKTFALATLENDKRPAAIQIFGSCASDMETAAKKLMKLKPDVIDINMGCPVPKSVKNGCGAALLSNPKLCGEIVKAVTGAVDVPVTVKIRKGINDGENQGIEVAVSAAENGASAIFVHGRTASMMYSGKSDRNVIKTVKQLVNIPVIGNGDIASYEDAESMISETGCDGVMIGRACLGNPWIFAEIAAGFEGKPYIPPSNEEKTKLIKRHIEALVKIKGEYTAVRESRKQLCWYSKGTKDSAELRRKSNTAETIEEIMRLAESIYGCYKLT